MENPDLSPMRVDYANQTVTGRCSCCGEHHRMSIVDLDRLTVICEGCVRPSIDAARALRQAGLLPPDTDLIMSDL